MIPLAGTIRELLHRKVSCSQILFKKHFLNCTIYAYFANSNHILGMTKNVYSSTNLYRYI